MGAIAYCAIYPGIGIARVGDSPDEFFIGPERPGQPGTGGPYKDRAGRIKRQAARFRIFAFDAGDNPVRELTASDAEITWTVHLVNRKGDTLAFEPPKKPEDPRRNKTVPDGKRASLVIDPGSRTIKGPDAAGAEYLFDKGAFLGEEVPLGELRTDSSGRLLVLGGHGRSGSVPPDAPLPHFADNDGWYDDTSDGPVTATVELDGETLTVKPSWVVVAPPDFAPSITNLVTLYDVAEQVAVAENWVSEPDKVSFDRDIRPLLERVMGYQWVSGPAQRGHRIAVDKKKKTVERLGDFFEPTHLGLLIEPDGEEAATARRRVFRLIRTPGLEGEEAKRQARPEFMPQLSGDGGRATPGDATTWFTVTPLQYRRLQKWADSDFIAGTPGGPIVEPDRDDAAPGPDELDRAALESCVGGPFYPGIEVSSRCRDAGSYAGKFRFGGALKPGEMTERMAVPWQADFTDCRNFWWPAQRPDDVITDEDYRAITERLYPRGDSKRRPIRTTAFPRWRWDRGIGDQIPTSLQATQRRNRRHREMVNEWSQLGFVTPSEDNTGVRVETERGRYAGLRHRDYFHIMLNLDRYPDFLPVARNLADGFLDIARKTQRDPLTEDELHPFEYEERAFDARLNSIYDDLVDVAEGYDPDRDQRFRTRADVIERLRQSAPFNQTDGVWLRNIATIGPIDDLTGYLTRIWIDEVGSGDPAQNHANVYTQTLASVGIHNPPITDIAYAQNRSLLESAFTLPLFQLVVSQFTEHFFPELLGMTLWLEWESVELSSMVRLLRKHDLDARYYELHVAIDNAASGHGALAKQAVKRYLAGFTDEAVRQQCWHRIWDGYVAFRTSGTFGQDLTYELTSPTRARNRVIAMIEEKKRYGSLNHGQLPAGTGMSNNLFDAPDQLLDALVDSRQVIPGEPERSPFMRHMKFDGPMYRVFSAEEEQRWADWIRSLAQTEAGDRQATDPFAAAAKPLRGDEAPPPLPAGEVTHLLFSSSPEELQRHPRKTLLGHGAAH